MRYLIIAFLLLFTACAVDEEPCRGEDCADSPDSGSGTPDSSTGSDGSPSGDAASAMIWNGTYTVTVESCVCHNGNPCPRVFPSFQIRYVDDAPEQPGLLKNVSGDPAFSAAIPREWVNPTRIKVNPAQEYSTPEFKEWYAQRDDNNHRAFTANVEVRSGCGRNNYGSMTIRATRQ